MSSEIYIKDETVMAGIKLWMDMIAGREVAIQYLNATGWGIAAGNLERTELDKDGVARVIIKQTGIENILSFRFGAEKGENRIARITDKKRNPIYEKFEVLKEWYALFENNRERNKCPLSYQEAVKIMQDFSIPQDECIPYYEQ